MPEILTIRVPWFQSNAHSYNRADTLQVTLLADRNIGMDSAYVSYRYRNVY